MAASTCVGTFNAFPKGNDNTQRHQIKFGTIAISASPGTYPTGGLPVTFAVPGDIKGLNQVPLWMDAFSTALSGYIYQYNPATGKLQVLAGPVGASYAANAPLSEIPVAATPAAVSGDTIVFRAEFARI